MAKTRRKKETWWQKTSPKKQQTNMATAWQAFRVGNETIQREFNKNGYTGRERPARG